MTLGQLIIELKAIAEIHGEDLLVTGCLIENEVGRVDVLQDTAEIWEPGTKAVEVYLQH